MSTAPSPLTQQADPDVDSYYAGLAQQQQQIGQNLAVTSGGDPDQAGEAQRLAQRFGVSPQLVQNNLMDFRRKADVEDALVRVATGSSPILRQQLQDPNFAAIAHDQIDNLSATERLFNWIGDAGNDISNQYEAGHLQYERGVLGNKAQENRATPDDWTRIQQINQRLQQIGPQKTLIGGLSNLAGTMAPQGPLVLGAGAVGGILGGAAGFLGGPAAPATVPAGMAEGFSAGSEAAMGERAYTMMAGNSYLDMLDKGVSHDTAKWASAGVGLINGALQVGGAKLVSEIPGVAALSDAAREAMSKAAGMEIADAMTRPSVNLAVKSAVGRFLASSGEGGLLMAGQELTNQVALNAAELHDTGKFDLQTDEGRAAAGRALGQAFVNGALTIGSLHAATGMLAFNADMSRANDAQQSQDFFTSLHDNAADSKVRERNPATYEGYIAAQAQGGPAQTIYVDGKQMAGVLAQSGLDPERVERVMPGLMSQVNEAAATGGDVQIPTEQYAARLAGTEVGKAMLPHMRMDPDALSSQEAAEFQSAAQAKFDEARQDAAQQMAANVALAQSGKSVEDDIFRQLKATGTMPNDAARTNAQFVRDFVETQAARMNVTPEDFYDRYRYTVQRAAAGEQPEAAPLHQEAIDGIRSVIEAAKQPGHAPQKASIAPADPWLVETAKQHGVDLEGFNHVIDGSGFRHAMKEHGNQATEGQRGQIALTEQDFERIPEVLAEPDRVIFGTKNKIGRDQIGYVKRMQDGSVLYVEEARTGRKELATVSMRKHPATMDADRLAANLHLNAQGDGIEPIVVRHPSADKNEALYQSGAPGGENLDIRSIMEAHTDSKGLKMGSASDALSDQVKAAIDSGKKVTLYSDGTPIPIVGINRGMMQDAKGQRWGSMSLFTDPDGKLGNRVQVSSGTPAGGKGESSAIIDEPRLRAAAPKPVLEKLERSGGAIASFASRPDEWNLLPGIRAAVARLGGVESEGEPANPVVDALAQTLDGDPKAAQEAFKKYAHDAGDNEPERATTTNDAFDAFNNAFGSKLTPEEFHDALEEAAQRQNTASDADLSRAAARGQGAGGGQPDVEAGPGAAGNAVGSEPGSRSGAGVEPAVADERAADDAVGRPGGAGLSPAELAGKRGGFNPSTLTTLLGQKADMSTFLHETGHYFLSVYSDLAGQPDAPPEVKADMDALLHWFGVKDLDTWHRMSLEEQRPYHEQFAYSFEKYLAEGKAPSKQTEGIFSRFAQWLKRVYVSIRDETNTIYRREHGTDLPIMTGEVREVMDRMLASTDQIREREAIENMVPMFKTAEQAGMNSDEWAAYQDMHREASEQASNELGAKSIQQMQWLQNARGRLLREMQGQHDALRAGVREEVAGEVANDDLYRAQKFLKTGELRREDGEEIQALVGHKLDTDKVKAMFPESGLGEKPDLTALRGMMKKGGTDPDILAPMFGFLNGEQMVRQIADARPMNEEIEARTDQRMLERHGDMNTPQEREAAIQKALHNEARARFVGVELRHLEKATQPVRNMLEAAKRAAQQMLADTKIGDINPRDYEAAEARAARAATDAMKRGDSGAAAQAKRSQLLQNALAREARRVRDQAGSQLDYLSKFAKPTKAMAKAVGADFMDRINELVAGYQLGARDTHGADPRPLNAWVNDYYDKNGVMPSVSGQVMANLGRMHWKDMTPVQLGELHDAVKSLYYIGKRDQTVILNGEEMQRADLVRELKAPLADLPHDKNRDVRADLQHGSGVTKMSAKFLDLKSGVRSLDAALLKMEQLFQWFGAGKYAGLREAPIDGGWSRVFRMASDAEAAERGMRAKSGTALRALGETLRGTKVNLDDSLYVPEMPRPERGDQWYREELLSAALNMGNRSNRDKMLQHYGWGEYQVVSAINRLLSKPEMDFVQGVWDHIGSYGQDIVEQKRRLEGITPKMIEAEPLQTKWGSYRGGYYPMVYDSFLDRSIAEKNERSADRLFENNYAKPSTNDGHTIERTGYVGPVSFSLSVIARHLDQVTHDLAWREPIVDMNKILGDRGLKDEVDQTWGRQYSKQFRPWLQAMANNRVFDNTMDSAWENIFRRVRRNATMVGIGFRASTVLTHGTTALSNSMGELGPKWFMKGTEQFMGIDRVKATRDFVYERSPEMAHRMDEADRNLHEAIDEINHHQESFRSPTAAMQLLDKARKFAYRGVMISDMASALPTWMGAYLKGMAKEPDGGLNLSEDDAIDYANRTVRNAHGGGGVKDLASVQRDKGALSLATMFYSYWNHVYQRMRDLGKGWSAMLSGQGTVSDMPRLLARSWFYFVLPQIAHAFWSTRQNKDDDNTLDGFAKRTAEETALGMVAGLPVFRDIATSVAEGRDYKLTPLEEAGQSFVTTTRDAYHLAAGEPVSKHALQTAANTAGYAFGLPLSQPAATTHFLWDYMNGDVDPQSMKEWYEGVLTGHIR